MDDHAQLISYEEYYPYGSTSYQAVRSQTETPKAYRYTGKERDEESGLHYFGARYYASWLGRWTGCDLILTSLTSNLYLFVNANPIIFQDLEGLQPTKEEKLSASAKKEELDQPYPSSRNKSLDLEIKELSKWRDSQGKPKGFEDRVKDIIYERYFEQKGIFGFPSIVESGRASLIWFSKHLFKDVSTLNETEKRNLFKKDVNATMAILLYEFATGTGPEKRTFTKEAPIIQSIIGNSAFQVALLHYFKENKVTGTKRDPGFENLRPIQGFFGFSPGEAKLLDSAKYHTIALAHIITGDWSRLYFGGMHYRVSPNKEGGLNLVFIDEKTRNSFFSHMPPDVSRRTGKPLGSTYQAYAFSMSAASINKIIRVLKDYGLWFRATPRMDDR
jgi:RHS repeat-associated protein